VATTVASVTPTVASADFSRSEVTFGSWNLISQAVPPV
jgi:hypothetical protein